MSKETLLSALVESESAVSGNNFDKKIREDFNKIKRQDYKNKNKRNQTKPLHNRK